MRILILGTAQELDEAKNTLPFSLQKYEAVDKNAYLMPEGHRNHILSYSDNSICFGYYYDDIKDKRRDGFRFADKTVRIGSDVDLDGLWDFVSILKEKTDDSSKKSKEKSNTSTNTINDSRRSGTN